MKNLTTFFVRAAMLLLLAVFTTTPARAQEPDLGFITELPTVDGGQASGWSDGALGHFVDGDLSTKYGLSTADPWIEFHYSSAITPKGYALWTASDTEGRRNPKSWTIKAKNSGDTDWTTLTTVNNSAGDKLPKANNTRTVFILNNSTAYQYYRFEATRTTSGENANQFQLAELQFCTVSPATYLQYALVTGLQGSYHYDNGNDIAINYTVTAADGTVLTKDTHFTETIKNNNDETVTSVAAEGNYTLTITAIAPYYGSQTLNFSVVDGTDLSTITSNYTAQDGETLTGTLGGKYKISIADGATVTLNDVTINGYNSNNYQWAGITCEGNATIVLESGTTNTVSGFQQNYPGIYIPEGKTLTIKGSGSLNASSNGWGAGIGAGYENKSCGNIIIEDGDITAMGGQRAAGIGGAYLSNCGNITITGGTIITQGGVAGAGIGGGMNATCGNIAISGGTITATGGTNAAGIGGALNGSCGNITITSDVISVTATKGTSANSIGAAPNGSCGTVTIGDEVTGNISQSPYIYVPVRIVLADGTEYTRTEDYSVNTAIYKRTIEGSRVGKHQSWLVPFDYTIKATDLQKFSFYKINMIANAPNPGEGTSSDLWVFLTKLETAGIVLHANMPYVIKAKEEVTNYAFTSTNTTLKAKNTGVILKTETAEDVYSFYATYEDTPASGSDQFYYVSSLGNICLGTSVTIGPYRWIIRKTNKFGGTTSYAREMHFFDGEEDDATGLNEFDNFTNSQSDDCWYDLSGRIVKSSNSPSVKLPRGIYIHGGRKEAIR